MSLLLLHSHRTEAFSVSHPTPPARTLGGAHGFWRGHIWDSQPQVTKGIIQTMQHRAQHIEPEEEGGRRGHLEQWCFSSHVMELCFSGDAWTPICPWEAGN